MAPLDMNPGADGRLSIRASAGQKSALKRAAAASQMNVSQFVLQASLSEAERVLTEESRLVVQPEEFALLCRLMDAPPRELKRLREFMSKKPVWDA